MCCGVCVLHCVLFNKLQCSKMIFVTVPVVTVEALNNFANESVGEAQFLLRRSGDTDVEATVVFETTSPPPGPSPATGDKNNDNCNSYSSMEDTCHSFGTI